MPGSAGQGLEINFRPDPAIWDGRYANNAWLQELPKPLNLLTWDNAVMMSPATAEQLGVQLEDLVEVRYGGRAVQGGVWIWPGHVDNAVTVYLGYGRSDTGLGSVASSTQAHPKASRSPKPWARRPARQRDGLQRLRAADCGGAVVRRRARKLSRSAGKYKLATTQFHWQMEGRDLVKTGTLTEYQQNPNFAAEPARDDQPVSAVGVPELQVGHGDRPDRLRRAATRAWWRARPRTTCPTVGKEGVYRQREMHWLRVDRYYEGTDLDDPQTVFQPVPCMHCETAPCEVVCPVAATVHSEDGLNDMVYNRCVGTRYCSNNCPYKVRRFNFFSYTDQVAARADAEDGAEPGRDGAQPRRDGEVHVLRAAHPRGTGERRDRGPADSRGRGDPGLRGGLPDPRDLVRQPERPGRGSERLEGAAAELCAAGRAEHAAAHDVPGRAAESESGNRGVQTRLGMASMTTDVMAAEPTANPAALEPIPVMAPGQTMEGVTEQITDLVLNAADAAVVARGHRPGPAAGPGVPRGGDAAVRAGASASGALEVPVAWAFAITNFVWWIGIGHAGTLISAILLLLRQEWRTSINRLAEAMTVFAVLQAALFPLLHLGRPWLLLLAAALPEHDGPAAAVPQPARVGRLCGLTYMTRSRRCSGSSA